MPVVLILLAVSAPERPFPTMQACAQAAPAVARRAGRGAVPVCVTVAPTVRRGR
ncbi:hypothetical protein BGCPKDLD_5288 [Methylorubrum suomiense]|uniref:Uncharacterized protein n=1 Tax=Methylorubrum suomiense TaxID=144191 RepID=A0ABQ4V2T3_9HYPH|nr:hypothetical protein BGCPKDLD_5288 [Methylorubrum suomiense]